MSEIKFRAIINKNTVVHFTLNDFIEPIFSIRELVIPWLRAGNKPDIYTNINDKNGKEIYEGDILADTSPDVSYILGIVTYNETPDCIYAGSFYLTDEDGYASDWDDTEPEHWHNYEVIGNIHENPELMEVRE